MADNPITDLLADIDALRDQDRTGRLTYLQHVAVVEELAEKSATLLELLDLVAYPIDPDTDDRLEQVVLSVHGVEISVRGRATDHPNEHGDPTGDVLVHIEDQRDDDNRRANPLTVDVNENGEHQYT